MESYYPLLQQTRLFGGDFFHVKKILTVCSSACRFHTMVVQNLFQAISEKNRMLVQKLADFLSVDRSAMSSELCKMREEGLLLFHRNHFTLL